MKKLVNSLNVGFFIKALLLISFTFVSTQLSFGQNFASLIGDAASNSFSKIKPYTSANSTNLYACGSRTISGTTNATFSKISLSGTVLWSVVLNTPSSAFDFEKIEGTNSNEFFLVGRTEPSNPGDDNRSFITKIIENPGGITATVGTVSLYDQNGREVFSEIIKKNVSGSWRYYVSGIFINGSISGTDDFGAVHVFDGNCTLINRWRYRDLAAFDSESGAGLINWGSEILVHGNRRGNDGNNFGHFFTINPTTGVIGASKHLPNNVYILDAYRGTNGDLYICGNILGSTDSYISRLDGSTFMPKWGHILTGDNLLFDISQDASGNLYAISQNAGGNYWINKIQDNGTSATLLSSRRILETGSSDNSFNSGHLYVNPSANFAYYTDSRLKAGTGTTGFGQTDIVLLKQGLNFENFSCNTTTQKSFPASQGIIENLPLEFTVLQAAPLTTAQGGSLVYERKAFCGQPCIDITQTKIECGPINAAGVQTYIVSGLISNGNNISVPTVVTSGSGICSGFSPNSVPANASNVPFSFTYTPTSTNNNPCWVIKYADDNGNIICLKDFCLPLPICKACIEVKDLKVVCDPKNAGAYLVTGLVTSNINVTTNFDVILSPITGIVTNKVPGTIAANAVNQPFSFTYTGSNPLCFYLQLSANNVLCKSTTFCPPLPNLDACCVDIKYTLECNKNTKNPESHVFNVTITNPNPSETLTLLMTSSTGILTTTSIVVAPNTTITVPIYYTPYAGTTTGCIAFTSGGIVPFPWKICKGVEPCVPLPICPSNPCCPTIKASYATCQPHNLVIGTYTATGTHCIKSITINATAGITAAGNITGTGISPTTWALGTPTVFPGAGVNVTNLSCNLTAAAGASGTVTLNIVLCDGSICKQTFGWNKSPILTGGAVVNQANVAGKKIYVASFSLDNIQKSKAKFISLGFSNKDQVEKNQPNIIAITGSFYEQADADFKKIEFENTRQAKYNAFFELKDENVAGKTFSIVFSSEKPDLEITYLVTDADGNQVGTKKFLIDSTKLAVKVEEVSGKSSNQVFLFPNPANNTLKVSYLTPNEGTIKLEIFDIVGQHTGITSNENVTTGTNEFSLDTSSLISGSYILKISSANQTQSYRLQIVK